MGRLVDFGFKLCIILNLKNQIKLLRGNRAALNNWEILFVQNKNRQSLTSNFPCFSIILDLTLEAT